MLSNPKEDTAVLYVRCMYDRPKSLNNHPSISTRPWVEWCPMRQHTPRQKSGKEGIRHSKSSPSCHEFLGNYSNLLIRLPTSAADAYGLGLLIHFAFNPNQTLPATAQPPHSPPTAASRGAIPTSMFLAFKKLLNPNPKARLSPAHFLELGMSETAGDGSGFFASNRLVKVCAGLDNFNLASEGEKSSLLKYVSGFVLVLIIHLTRAQDVERVSDIIPQRVCFVQGPSRAHFCSRIWRRVRSRNRAIGIAIRQRRPT